MKFSVKIAGIFAVVAFALTAVSANAAFTRSLTLGSTGADVIELQTWLEAKGFLTIPAGVSKGYFGAMTQSALAKYQASAGIVPAAGYFGPITMAKIAGAPMAGGDDDSDSDNGSSDLGNGEASLESFDLSSGDDSDVEEGDSAEVAEIEFDVEDGDIDLNRVDLAINGVEDAWEVFESVSLLVDGKEIASKDLSDEDEYLDEDDGTVRISDIDFSAVDGDTVTIVVEVTVQDNVDDSDLGAYTINVLDDGIRATDGEGLTQETGNDSETVSFDVDEAGTDDELNVSTSSEDPDAGTLQVEDDSKSDSLAIFAFDLESEESDIEINTVELEVETGTADVNDVVADFTLEIDGEEFTDWSFVDGDDGATTTATIAFDIDGDYTLDADSEVTVVLMAEFKAANGVNYSSSETITASIVDAAIDAEGGDDMLSEGEATGDVHTLVTEGVVVDGATKNFTAKLYTSDSNVDDAGEFKFVVSLTAMEDDFFIPNTVGISSSTAGFSVVVTGDSYTGTTTARISEVDLKDETKVNNRYKVTEGEDATFTVVVELDPSVKGSYGVELDLVHYSATSTAALSTYTLPDTSEFEFGTETINN